VVFKILIINRSEA